MTLDGYIKGLNLEDMDWKEYTKDTHDGYCLAIVESPNNFLYIELVDGSSGRWLSPDDMGWSGPVKHVVMFCPIIMQNQSRQKGKKCVTDQAVNMKG